MHTSISGFPRSGYPSEDVERPADPLQGRCGMAASLIVGAIFGLALLFGASPVRAQVSGLYWQCVAPSGGTPAGYCPVNNTYPLPVAGSTTSGTLTIVAGTQTALTISSATALTVPATATTALVQAQGTNNTSGVCLYWRDDGTNPTGSVGQQMAAGATMFYHVTSLPIKMFAATGATCVATISYYK